MSALRSRVVFLLPMLAFVCLVTLGATVTYTGKDEGFWDKRSVIVGRIEEVTGAGYPGERLRIHVLAVIATDLMIREDLVVPYRGGPDSALVGVTFHKGDIAILCLDKRKDGWWLSSECMTFFDSGNAVVKVRSLDDPAVARHVARIQSARRASRHVQKAK